MKLFIISNALLWLDALVITFGLHIWGVLKSAREELRGIRNELNGIRKGLEGVHRSEPERMREPSHKSEPEP